MSSTWEQSEIFPLIAEIITSVCAKEAFYITHREIGAALLRHPVAQLIIGDARDRQREERSLEWVAHNMVSWFSQRITVRQSIWEKKFERKKIDGRWAYKAKDTTGKE